MKYGEADVVVAGANGMYCGGGVRAGDEVSGDAVIGDQASADAVTADAVIGDQASEPLPPTAAPDADPAPAKAPVGEE